jgi:hypothetical protein
LFINALRHTTNIRSFSQAQIAASSFLDLASFELRMLGSGMPLTQGEFKYEDPNVGARALPLLLSASPTEMTFRFNETGASAVLTSDFIPSSSNSTLSVDSTIGFGAGDTVYISSLSAGGSAGLYGVINRIIGNSIQLSTFTTNASARFPASSIIQPVTEVTYRSTPEGIVTRTSARGEVIQSKNTAFELTYLDGAGQPLSLPLSPSTIRDSLAGIRIIVRVGARSIFDDSSLTTEAQQTVALRNLILSR